MAIVTRYFSTSSAGAGDGTSWADRAALFSAGNWSSVITGFAFNGSDSLECLIGPGSYTCSQSLASGLFTNAPSIANPLIMAGCNSSGVLLAIPDPDWASCQPAFDDSTLPVIATTTNIATNNLANSYCYLLKFTASGRNGAVMTAGNAFAWCVIANSTANTSATAITTSTTRLLNCVLTCSGSSYDTIASFNASLPVTNCRLEGVTGSSGNRRGMTFTGNSVNMEACTIVNCGGEGVVSTSTGTGQSIRIFRSVIANNGSTGLKSNSTASQTDNYETHGCMVTGNGAWGIDGNSAAARWWLQGNRLRDNTSGNITGLGNYPTDLNNYTTDSDDSSEYVSAGANGDFRIKNTAAIWGMGFGVADEPASAGGGGLNRATLPSGLGSLG